MTYARATSVFPRRGWLVKSSLPGRIRIRHTWLRRYTAFGQNVRTALLNLKGVTNCEISYPTANVLVKYDPADLTADVIMTVLVDAVSELSDGPALEEVAVSDLAPHPSARQMYFSTLNLGFSFVMTSLPALAPLSILFTLAVAGHIIWSGLKALVIDHRLKVDILDATVILMLLYFGRPRAAAVMVSVVDTGNALLEATTDRSRKLLTDLFGAKPRKVWLLVRGAEVERDVADLKPGNLIVVRTGEPIPVDGEVVDGEAMIDQHVLTGEAAAVERTTGEPVFAMTTVLAGRIVVRVREAGDKTNAAKILQIINHTIEHKVRLQSRSELFADRMVLPTFGIGAVGYAVAGSDAMIAIINADYGTGIRVAAPLALLASVAIAARHGIVIKEGTVLERLAEIDVIVFDKTGTLTQETPEVGRVLSIDPRFSQTQILTYVACAESRFSHPIARAVLRRAESLGLALPEVDRSSYRVGFGIEVQVEGRQIRIGSHRYMEREGLKIPSKLESQLQAIHDRGRSTIFAAVGKRVVGMIELHAAERPEASRLLEVLRAKRGIGEVHLLSGDHQASTRSLAKRLGIEHYVANALPEDKAEYVRALQRQGKKVAMVGDGINDTVALSVADVSISLRGGADVAADVANVIFMDGDLAKFDLLFQISDALNRNVRRSVYMTVAGNSVLILGALGGVFGVGSSLLLNNVVNLAATINGLAPYYERFDTDPYFMAADSAL